MVKTKGETSKNKKTVAHLDHAILCDLKVVGAELSKEAGHMLSYEETIVELIRRHRDHKGVAA